MNSSKRATLINRLFALLKRPAKESELDAELSFHIEMKTRENIEAGMAPRDARNAALRSFGNAGLIREDTRRAWGFGAAEQLWQDGCYAARLFRKNPGFTVVVVLTLALGIGANTAIFSVVHGILLRPLPYHDASRLVRVYQSNARFGASKVANSIPDIEDANRLSSLFDGIACFQASVATLTGTGEPEQLVICEVSNSFFTVLGARPLIGRTFVEGDQGRDDLVIVSYPLWKRVFVGDESAIGRPVTLDGKSRTVIGVMPAGFDTPQSEVPAKTEVWLPLDKDTASRAARNVDAVGRLKPATTLPQARLELDSISARLGQAYKADSGWTFELLPLRDSIVAGVRTSILIIFAAVGLVLLITCANVAGLLLARGAGRRREIALRAAIGAGRGRIIRQLLTETLFLAATGGLLGLVAAFWGANILRAVAPKDIPRLEEITISLPVLIFNVGISLAAGLLFDVVPALQGSKTSLSAAFKDGGAVCRTGFGAGQPWAYRSLLMVVQVALSIVLLVGSGLMARSFQRLRSAGLGFNPNGVVTFWVNLPEAGYRTDAAKRDFYRRALERITAAPGVESVCVSSFLAFGPYITTSFNLEGQPLVPPREDQQAAYKVIGFGYFKTLSIPLLAGREFSRDDRTGTRPVAIVSKAFADKYFPGQSPVGKRIHTDWEGEPAWREIVGVAANVMDCGSLFDSSPEFYGPIMQASPPGSLAFLVKSGRDPKSMERSLRSLILSVDKDQPISHVQTMDESHSEMLAEPRFETELASSFSILALVLAGVGLYGLVSYSVTERTQEVGIRMALGASRHHLLALLMGRGMVAVFAGIAVGLAASIALTRFISSLLNGVSPTDAVTFIAVPLLLAGVTMAASYLPARRAIKLDPVHVLRYE